MYEYSKGVFCWLKGPIVDYKNGCENQGHLNQQGQIAVFSEGERTNKKFVKKVNFLWNLWEFEKNPNQNPKPKYLVIIFV